MPRRGKRLPRAHDRFQLSPPGSRFAATGGRVLAERVPLKVGAALDAADPSLLVFDTAGVLERLGAHGELFSDVLTLVQRPA